MSWEKEMDDAISAQTPMTQVWDAQKGKLVEVDFNTAARASIEALATVAEENTSVIGDLLKGSITFSADASAPCHCANCVVLEQEVERLRLGNAELLKANKHLQDRIHDLEGKQ